MRGMILAAGYGTRLRPLTLYRAKPAVPFLNRPLIQYSLDLFQKAGVKEVVVNTHHLPETVQQAAQRSGMDILFSYENTILGTAGALKQVEDFLKTGTFLLSNGKIFFEGDLREALLTHRQSKALVTLVVVPYYAGDPFLPVVTDSDLRITGFARNKPNLTADSTHFYIFTGIQIVEPQLLEFIPKGFSDSIADIYPGLIQAGYRLQAHLSQAYWCETSTPLRYLEKSLEVLRRKRLERLSESHLEGQLKAAIVGSSVRCNGPISVTESVIWDHVHIGSNSSLHRVVAVDGVNLPRGFQAREVILTPRDEKILELMGSPVDGDCEFAIWPLE
ncbi:MAG TPA: sugar phosphate nucleotidyltransferase [Acidobacteriota bacterium]|nr:sugar phosphate nucleotidyltransferase [Acidobacteriota bacterium]